MKERVKEIIQDKVGSTIERIDLMSGDASARCYYKAITNEGESFIVCTESPNGQQSTDFIKMNSILSEKIKRPALVYYNLEESIVVQEDLGSESLNSYSGKQSKEERIKIYKKAIDGILEYQTIDKSCLSIVGDRSFDYEKLSFEFDLAVENFIIKYLKYKLTNEDLKTLKETKDYLIDYFKMKNKVVCHRDFHGRNLMIRSKEVYHIDFQDARVGPASYDLCSLLDDCYFKLNESDKNILEGYYLSKSSFYRNREELELEYNTVATQRIFKAIGSFTYLKYDKNKPEYERYIAFAFENLREKLEELPVLEKFRSLLNRAYYEY